MTHGLHIERDGVGPFVETSTCADGAAAISSNKFAIPTRTKDDAGTSDER
jgi:hypothetical protein